MDHAPIPIQHFDLQLLEAAKRRAAALRRAAIDAALHSAAAAPGAWRQRLLQQLSLRREATPCRS